MKRIKITLPKGGTREVSKMIGETRHSSRVNVSPASYEFEAEEIIIEGDVTFSGNVNSPKQDPLPFDLEAAKAGAPLVTRDGRKARFVGHTPEATENSRVVVMIEGYTVVTVHHEDGSFLKDFNDSRDLFMAPKPKRSLWINLYPAGSNGRSDCGIHGSEEEARKAAGHGCIGIAQRVEIDA